MPESPEFDLVLFSATKGREGFGTHMVGPLREQYGDRVSRVLHLSHALEGIEYERDPYTAKLKALFEGEVGVGFDPIHELAGQSADRRRLLEEAEAVFVSGGNTYNLKAELERDDMWDLLNRRVREGIPFAGVSAGSVIAGTTIASTNDWRIAEPSGPQGMQWLPFALNVHYPPFGDGREAQGQESRDDRIRRLKAKNPGLTVMGITEDAILRVTHGGANIHVDLSGGPGKLFLPGMDDPIVYDVPESGSLNVMSPPLARGMQV